MQAADDGAVLDQLESDLLAVESALAELDRLTSDTTWDDPADGADRPVDGDDRPVDGDDRPVDGEDRADDPAAVADGGDPRTGRYATRRDAILGVVDDVRFAARPGS